MDISQILATFPPAFFTSPLSLKKGLNYLSLITLPWIQYTVSLQSSGYSTLYSCIVNSLATVHCFAVLSPHCFVTICIVISLVPENVLPLQSLHVKWALYTVAVAAHRQLLAGPWIEQRSSRSQKRLVSEVHWWVWRKGG